MFPSNADASPRDVAIQLLARREYSRVELARKLQQKSFDGVEIEACLDALAEQSLQSDARFAESFVRSRIARGQGVIRIKGELRQRGIDQETLTAALAAVEEREAVDWFELAKETLARRYDSPGDTPKERAKRERFLATRGFDFEQIRYALSCL
ncbi:MULTISPECIES: regulatory protein RecX [Halomonadaceae]|jgi:regulatory protein|uniref:regulatory protein RecX n=1 Tax=Halomonadaceae TaxID=28256 RepID=UPI001118C916|nr:MULTISPECIES: regulatory protein RecX [Halomonas]MCG7589208.1 recombination regulator RecX [Halomonas sp. McD50-5]MCG7615369.1 recombination regulator RecX [Halomonas sp. McD50-4]TNH19715.1 regulatory protein RecX [Halomonas sp. BL6]BCB61198.1 regulatory protein RecX [Halomonas sp. A020]